MCRTAKLNFQKSLTHLEWNTNQYMHWKFGGTCIKPSRLVYAPDLIPSVQLQLFKYWGSDNAQWISMNKMAVTPGQRELCGTNFSENMENLWLSCYIGNNDRAAWTLFVKHLWTWGEILRQNPRFARVLTASFAQSPWVLHKQHPCRPGHYPLINSLAWEDAALMLNYRFSNLYQR